MINLDYNKIVENMVTLSYDGANYKFELYLETIASVCVTTIEEKSFLKANSKFNKELLNIFNINTKSKCIEKDVKSAVDFMNSVEDKDIVILTYSDLGYVVESHKRFKINCCEELEKIIIKILRLDEVKYKNIFSLKKWMSKPYVLYVDFRDCVSCSEIHKTLSMLEKYPMFDIYYTTFVGVLDNE